MNKSDTIRFVAPTVYIYIYIYSAFLLGGY